MKKKKQKQQIVIKKQPSLADTFLGFPRVKGSWNNLWRWDTLENVNF